MQGAYKQKVPTIGEGTKKGEPLRHDAPLRKKRRRAPRKPSVGPYRHKKCEKNESEKSHMRGEGKKKKKPFNGLECKRRRKQIQSAGLSRGFTIETHSNLSNSYTEKADEGKSRS